MTNWFLGDAKADQSIWFCDTRPVDVGLYPFKKFTAIAKAMPRKLPTRPQRLSKRSSHPFLPPGLRVTRSLIHRPSNDVESTGSRKLPPKIVAMDAVPRIPLSPSPSDHTLRIARIEQIKKLYSPREFKRLRDQQLKLVLPESPLKTTSGRIRLGLLFWIYFSMLVYSFGKFLIILGFEFTIFRIFIHEAAARRNRLGLLEEVEGMDAGRIII